MTADTTDTGRAEPDNKTYGLHVWLCARDGACRMDGIYGQFGIVLPEHHACVSVTGHYLGPTTHVVVRLPHGFRLQLRLLLAT